MATLEDIARELGVSKGTVSKALNGARDVSRKMQQAVLEKAVEMGYTRGIRKAAPRIALFVTNMEYTQPEHFGFDIVVGFRKAAEPAGYQVEIVPLDRQMQQEMPYDQFMMLHNYCGALFLGMSLLDPWIKEFETCVTPTVLYDNHISCNPCVTEVGVNNEEGIELAVRYLRGLGHRQIGYLSSALHARVYQQRYNTFLRVMGENGLTADKSTMGDDLLVERCITRHLPRLLRSGCTAIICSHDILAHSAIVHCQGQGLRVPEDVSILGFDDLPLCAVSSPAITTIRQNRPALGKSAFYALSCQMHHVPISTHLLHPELIRRASCGPVRKEAVTPAVPAE